MQELQISEESQLSEAFRLTPPRKKMFDSIQKWSKTEQGSKLHPRLRDRS